MEHVPQIGTPPSGSLAKVQWHKGAWKILCRDVVEGYRETLTPHARLTDSGEIVPIVFEFEEEEEDSSSVTISDDEWKDVLLESRQIFDRTAESGERTLSPSFNAARNNGIFFMKPDWDALQQWDPNYEQMLYRRREKGDVLFFGSGPTLRSSCTFFAVDPKWLIMQFFEKTEDRVVQYSFGQLSVPLIWQTAYDAHRFWCALRNKNPDHVSLFESKCVLQILLAAGACQRLDLHDSSRVFFPVLLFDDANHYWKEEDSKNNVFLYGATFESTDQRDGIAFALLKTLCSRQQIDKLQLRFFRRHVIVVDKTDGSTLLLYLFQGARSISVWQRWKFPVLEKILTRVKAQLESRPLLGGTDMFFQRDTSKPCNCSGSCATCIVCDVLRVLFLRRYSGAGLHTDSELLDRVLQEIRS